MDPTITNFLKLFGAFCEVRGYEETTASRIVLGNGIRIDRIKAGARTSVQTIQRAVERMSDQWPKGTAWPSHIYPRPKSKTTRNQTELAVAR